MKKQTIRIYKYALFVLLCYTYFTSMTDYFLKTNLNEGFLFVCVGVLLLINFFLFQRQKPLWFSSQQIGWIVMLLLSAFTIVSLTSSAWSKLTHFASMIMVIILLSNNFEWFSTAVRYMIFFTYVHAIATLLLFFFPDWHENILPWLNKSIHINGYKSGLTTHYSTNGIYLGIGCVVCWCRILYTSRKAARHIIMAILVTIALLLTTKRAHALFALLSILFVYVWGAKQDLRRWGKLFLAFFSGTVLFLLLSQIIPEIGIVIDRFLNPSGGDITNGRIPLYTLAWNMFLEKPLLGWGWRSYIYQYSLQLGTVWQLHNDAHNVFLQLLAEGGILSFLLFLYLAGSTFLQTARQFSYMYSSEITCEKNLSVYLAISFGVQTFFLLYCITGNPLYDIQCQIPYGLSCAVSYAVAYSYHIQKSKDDIHVKSRYLNIPSRS